VIRNQGGSSGTSSTIRIRGQSSITLDNDPLIFVDGVRIQGGDGSGAGGGQVTSRLNDIKIEDIESMEVVKGPAAATLYGSDANAGVINIITKKGRAGSGFTQTMTVEYGEADPAFESPDNYGICSAATQTGAANIAAFPNCQGKPVGTIVIDNPLKREDPFSNGRYRNFAWSLNGGGDRYGVYLSFGADDEQGTLPNNEYGRINGSARFDFLANDKLRMEMSTRITDTHTMLPRNDNDIYGYLGGGFLGDPRTVGSAKDGWYAPNRQVLAISSFEHNEDVRRFQPRFQISYTPYQWFTHRLNAGADMTYVERYSFFKKNSDGWWDSAPANTGQISINRQVEDNYTFDYLGNVTRSLMPDLRLDFSFGAQVLTYRRDRSNAQGTGLVNNDVKSVNAAAQVTGGQDATKNRQIGTYAQAQFSWREKLYVQAGARRDQVSSFGADSKPFISPKIGVSYVISDENYFKNATSFLPEGAITQLRLRTAFGVTGRHATSGARSTYSPTTNQITATTVTVGVNPGTVGNPALRPEKGEELEVGFDAGFIHDRLSLEMTYFHKETKDQILTFPVPASQGASGPSVNIGSLLNSGLETALTARIFTYENVAFEVRGQVATLHNELLDLGGVPETSTRKVGFPLSGTWNYRILNVDPVTNIVLVSDTLEFLGNSSNLPGWDGALTGNLTLFKNFSLYAQMDARGDRMVYNNTDQFRDRSNGFTAPAVLGPRAYGENADGTPTEAAKVKWMRKFGCIPAQFGGPAGTCTTTGVWKTQEWTDSLGVLHPSRNLQRTVVAGDYNEDATFFRLREASVSYRVPNEYVQRYMRARSASFTVTMRNIKTWTDFTGYDPETDQFLTVPQDRRWTARFQFTF
jgi:TonB-dependent starch-binding outer membrane protein SusC